MIRKVFLEELPKIKGRGKSSGQTINNWMGSVGHSFKFIYDGIDGVIEIVGYNKKSHELDVKYLNKYFKINTSLVINAQLGVVIGISCRIDRNVSLSSCFNAHDGRRIEETLCSSVEQI